MPTVLGIGNAVLDVVHLVNTYPKENSETRAIRSETRLGGNIANQLQVMKQLGIDAHWAGTLAKDSSGQQIQKKLQELGINTELAKVSEAGQTPTSHIILNSENGSRTILHTRNLEEFCYQDMNFDCIGPIDCLHVEARNVADQILIVQHIRSSNKHVLISVEIEKDRPLVQKLWECADILFISSHYTEQMKISNSEKLFAHLKTSNAKLIVHTKGSEGLSYLYKSQIFHLPAIPISPVLDTLAAGDVFIGSCLGFLILGHDYESAIARANRVAGKKCMQYGIENLDFG